MILSTIRLELLLPVIALSACAVPISQAGRQIGIVDERGSCASLGIVTGSNSMGATGSQDMDGAMNEVRNKAAKLGADSIRFMQVQTQGSVWSGGGSYVTAEALKCGSAAPAQPPAPSQSPSPSPSPSPSQSPTAADMRIYR